MLKSIDLSNQRRRSKISITVERNVLLSVCRHFIINLETSLYIDFIVYLETSL